MFPPFSAVSRRKRVPSLEEGRGTLRNGFPPLGIRYARKRRRKRGVASIECSSVWSLEKSEDKQNEFFFIPLF